MTNYLTKKQKRSVYDQIQVWMQDKKINQTYLAKEIGIRSSHISNVFHGKSDFSVESLERIGKIMGKNLIYDSKIKWSRNKDSI